MWKQQLYFFQRCVLLKSAVRNCFKDISKDYTDSKSFVNILRDNVSRDDKKIVNVFYDEVSNFKINQRIDLDMHNNIMYGR